MDSDHHNKTKQSMVFNSTIKAEKNKGKQIDFVSRLTFVRGLKDQPERIIVKNRNRKKFKHWDMPVQPTGYIKVRKHDFL